MKTISLARIWFLAILLCAAVFVLCSKDRPLSQRQTHSAGWIDPSSPDFHGLKAASLDTSIYNASYCKSCHGQDFSGGTSGVSCYSCHNDPKYPHDETTWGNPADSLLFHGTDAVGDKKIKCQICHGYDYKGGKSSSGCYTCHTTYPHANLPQWSDSADDTLQFHAQAVINGKKAECETCHGKDFTGGTSGKSCYLCHTLGEYPHQPAWLDSPDTNQFYHGMQVIYAGSANDCKWCHGADFKGGLSKISCYTCHNYPHLTGWSQPDSLNNHGTVVHTGGDASCRLCHGSDLSGGKTMVSCDSCHAY